MRGHSRYSDVWMPGSLIWFIVNCSIFTSLSRVPNATGFGVWHPAPMETFSFQVKPSLSRKPKLTKKPNLRKTGSHQVSLPFLETCHNWKPKLLEKPNQIRKSSPLKNPSATRNPKHFRNPNLATTRWTAHKIWKNKDRMGLTPMCSSLLGRMQPRHAQAFVRRTRGGERWRLTQHMRTV